MKGKKIFGAIICLTLLGGMAAAPAQAAGKVGGIVSDTTARVVRSAGTQYRFTVTLPKNEAVSYTAGNGKILGTFAAAKPTKNANGTVTYHLGFICLSAGDSAVYVRIGGKAVRLFPVHVLPDYAAIQKAVDAGHQPWRLNPTEVAAQFVADNRLEDRTDTLTDPAVAKNTDGSATVIFRKDGKETLKLTLYQPVKKAGGIWVVRSWKDLATGVTHEVG